jgi:hypothetical protein
MILIVGKSGAQWKYFEEIMYSCRGTIKYYRNKMESGQGGILLQTINYFLVLLETFL